MDRSMRQRGNRPELVRRLVAAAVVGAAGVALLVPGTAGASTTSRTTRAPKPVYAVALGDSLAAGTGASQEATRYVNVLAAHEAATYPGLQLVNLSCGGATVQSMINGPGCSYTTGTQLGDAEAFLQAHLHQVAYVTIDIGGNNVDNCTSGQSVNLTCVTDGINEIQTDLPQILTGLETAEPGVAIYGMNYYDPFLAEWLTGSTGQTLAQESVSLATVLNSDLAGIYSAAGASTADVATPFQTSDFDLTGSWEGQTLPQNVADICNWTWMCLQQNIHTNDTGHAVLAQAFASVLDGVQVTTTELPVVTAGTKFSTQLTAAGGHPRYHWSLAPGSTLPLGVKLNARGILTGKPVAAGTTTFTVEVTDHRVKIHSAPPVHEATATLTLTVE